MSLVRRRCNAAAQASARVRSLGLGQAVSDLIRRGSAQTLPIERSGGVWVFELPPDAPQVSSLQVRQLIDEAECHRCSTPTP